MENDNSRARIDGPEYAPKLDFARMQMQQARIRDAMIDGKWRTLDEIQALTLDPQPSISAQLRHLRKARFGGWTVDSRYRGPRKLEIYEYRLSRPHGVVG